jgi:excinuclease UvrABC ATPase subunit
MDRRDTNHKWYSTFSDERMQFTIDDGEGGEMVIPAKYEVCDTCEGKGKHVNPSIDSNGLSQEDFDDDPDFRENYFSGMYDVPCNECHGNRVSPAVDESKMSKEDIKYVEEYISDFYSYQHECYRERMMGC